MALSRVKRMTPIFLRDRLFFWGVRKVAHYKRDFNKEIHVAKYFTREEKSWLCEKIIKIAMNPSIGLMQTKTKDYTFSLISTL